MAFPTIHRKLWSLFLGLLIAVPTLVSAAEGSDARARYTVRSGDTLWSIAAQANVLGDAWSWPLLWQANASLISDPDHIHSGWRLTLPPTPTEAQRDLARREAAAYVPGRGIRSAPAARTEAKAAAPVQAAAPKPAADAAQPEMEMEEVAPAAEPVAGEKSAQGWLFALGFAFIAVITGLILRGRGTPEAEIVVTSAPAKPMEAAPVAQPEAVQPEPAPAPAQPEPAAAEPVAPEPAQAEAAPVVEAPAPQPEAAQPVAEAPAPEAEPEPRKQDAA